jgi:AcrR family transcriptional regulator
MDSAEKRPMRLFFASLVDAMGKGQETRQRIIEQAAPLFNQGGMAGCSMQDILRATGLKKGGLQQRNIRCGMPEIFTCACLSSPLRQRQPHS